MMPSSSPNRSQSASRRESEPHVWGEWLGRFAWTFFITLTTDTEFSTAALERAAAKFSERVGAAAWFRVIEGVDSPCERRHIHMLVHVAGPVTVDAVRRCWSHGHADVVRYDPARGAATYIAKGFRKADYYDVSQTLPPQRADLCVRAERTDSDSESQEETDTLEANMSDATFGTMRVVVATDLDPIDLAAWARRYARVVIAAHRSAGNAEAA